MSCLFCFVFLHFKYYLFLFKCVGGGTYSGQRCQIPPGTTKLQVIVSHLTCELGIKLGPLVEQYVLLTAKPSPWPYLCIKIFFFETESHVTSACLQLTAQPLLAFISGGSSCHLLLANTGGAPGAGVWWPLGLRPGGGAAGERPSVAGGTELLFSRGAKIGQALFQVCGPLSRLQALQCAQGHCSADSLAREGWCLLSSSPSSFLVGCVSTLNKFSAWEPPQALG